MAVTHTDRILSDSRIEIAEQIFESPPAAGTFIRKQRTNGCHFWRLDPDGRRPLMEVRTEYLRVVSPEEAEEEDAELADADYP